MDGEEKYETKKAIFFADKIVLKKRKKDIVIERREIEKLCYARPTFLNYLFAGAHQLLPGQLAIWPKRPLKEGKKAGYVLWVRYVDYIHIPYSLQLLTEELY